MDYQYLPPSPSQEEVNSKIIKDSISSTLKSQLQEKYSPFNFSILETNKPKEFLVLDSLYNIRSQLIKKKKKHLDTYDSLLTQLNKEINDQKKKINQQKIYHSYQMDHIYIVTTAQGFTLHEDQFYFLPNFKLKKITPILSTSLSQKEKVLFEYFSLGYPLFETDDINYNHQMDELVYEKFNQALAIEKKNKADLIHTILYSISYIREYSSFDYEEIAKGMATNWIEKNKSSTFIPKFEQIREITENDEITSYSLTANNRKGQQSITFKFDLNIVITEIILK
jgi:hypothetical protein